jgi:hypothetical protein
MITLRDWLPLLARDFAVCAALGGVVGAAFFGEQAGFSFAAGCLWLGLNTVLLGMLIIAATSPRRPGKVALLALLCAKIPLAYILLLWLMSRAFIAPAGIIAALATLPVVIVWRGLAGRGGNLKANP